MDGRTDPTREDGYPPRAGPPTRARGRIVALGGFAALIGAVLLVSNVPAGARPSPGLANALPPSIGLGASQVAASPPSLTARPPTPIPSGVRADQYMFIPRAELMALHTTGTAWKALWEVAHKSLGKVDLCDQGTKHGVRALAAAIVYARTGEPALRAKVRLAIADAIETLRPGDCRDGALSLGRQLGSYVLAADFVALDGADDRAFRDFLAGIRTLELGGHSRWHTLTGTHEDANNNWGAFAGASRIAVALYLGDEADVSAVAHVLRGFLGDRSAYAGFRGQVDDSLFPEEARWACDADPAVFVPINPACERAGVDLDGAIVGDLWRDEGGLAWPLEDGSAGISYTLESLQGLIVQAELLYRNGYADVWTWSDSALRRVGDLIDRNAAADGQGWNYSNVSQHVPWLLNARLGTDYPTEPAGFGRLFGFTDWLTGG